MVSIFEKIMEAKQRRLFHRLMQSSPGNVGFPYHRLPAGTIKVTGSIVQ